MNYERYFIIDIVTDTVLLILAHGSKDRWSDFVSNPTTDLFSTTFIDNMQGTSTIVDLISRIKQGRYTN